MDGNILKIRKYSIVLKNMNNGLYVFYNESSTGKTCLKNLLDKCKEFGEPVSAYTYLDYMYKLSPSMKCKPTDSLVMFDRYDMYAKEFPDEVRNLAEHTIVLVDSKGSSFLPVSYRVCILDMLDPEHFQIVGE